MTSTLKLLNRATVARLAAAAARPSSLTATATKSREFHSSLDNPSMMLRKSGSSSSLRELDTDPSNWGYRVVVPNNRSYTTTSSVAFSTREDYDEYTLHVAPSEGTHCDLGVVSTGSNNPTEEVETLLQFDEAGFVRPIWETAGTGTTNDEAGDEWTMNSHSSDSDAQWMRHDPSAMNYATQEVPTPEAL